MPSLPDVAGMDASCTLPRLRLRLVRWLGRPGESDLAGVPFAGARVPARRWMVRFAGHPVPLRVLRWTLCAVDAETPVDDHLAAYLAAVHGVKVGWLAARRIRQRLGASRDVICVTGLGVASAAPLTTSVTAQEIRELLVADPTTQRDPARRAERERTGGVLEN